MLASAMRQAVRRGAHVAVIDARPVKLPFKASHLMILPEKLSAVLLGLKTKEMAGLERQEASFLEGVQQQLQQAQRPMLIGGGDFLQVIALLRLRHPA